MPLEKISINKQRDKNENYNPTHEKLLEVSFQRTSEERTSRRRGILAQCLITGAVMLSSASCGMPIGYSAILLPQLKSMNGTLQIDDSIGSWIASIHSAATPIGALLSGTLMEKFGRKFTLQTSAIPLVVGWLLIGFAHNHCLLLMGRLIAGISAGLAAAPGQVLIGEVSEPNVRGIFSSVPFVSYSFGILLVYALGSWLNWRIVAGISALLPVIAALVFFSLPESPVWLARKRRTEEARKSLIWLRGGDIIQAKQEFQELMLRIENENVLNPESKSQWKMMLEPQVLKPFVIINIFNVMQVLSGTYLVVFYAVDILSTLGSENIDNFLAAVLTACVRFMFTLVACVLLALIGRRKLALISGIGTGISALCLGFFLYLEDCFNSGYFAALCMLIYVALNAVGFMILPGVLLGELYPARVRGFAGGLTFTTFHFVLFAVAKLFPFIRNLIGVEGVFWLFGSSSLLASLFLYIMLPETKGRTLADIEDYFSSDNITWLGRKKRCTDAKCNSSRTNF